MTEQELIRRLEAIERELQKLRSQTAKLPTRSTGGGGSGVTYDFGDNPAAVVATGTVSGTGEDMSRSNHKHIGQPYMSGADKTALALITVGTFGYAQDTGRVYTKISTGLVCVSHLETP